MSPGAKALPAPHFFSFVFFFGIIYDRFLIAAIFVVVAVVLSIVVLIVVAVVHVVYRLVKRVVGRDGRASCGGPPLDCCSRWCTSCF